jgi:hypothetical protein
MELSIALVIIGTALTLSFIDHKNWAMYMIIAGISIIVLPILGFTNMTIENIDNLIPNPSVTTTITSNNATELISQACKGILKDGLCCEAFVNDKGVNCQRMETK